MKKNFKFNLVLNPPHGVHGITGDNHDFITMKLSSESLECVAWLTSLLQDSIVGEAQVEEDDPGLAAG